MERLLEYLREEFGIESVEEFYREYDSMKDIDIGLFV